jgi:serine/threonine-protein kinase
MTPADELRQLSSLLDEALDLPEEDRMAWLGSRRELADPLRARLRELLSCHADADDFTLPPLSRYSEADIAKLVGSGDAGAPAPTLLPDQTLGPYRLIRELGRGGMGSVWLAERSDGALKRQVALKLPHIAFCQDQLIDRFARERDILAGLVHPHIARLYDAGITQDGWPYLAMEYVPGQTLGDYCQRQNLDLSARLRLFRQVLRAIQYAHSQLIVHRDLKPGNILVTDEGYVRLLDFGIAKLLHDDATQAAELTELGGRALTLQYAAPEQILGQPIGPGADIYSLGVLLYELLAGAAPYRLKRATRGAMEEAILSAQPVPPSQAGRSQVAWAKRLAGDLDAILLKALKKDPAERYLTASAFTEDIDRHLNGEPVLAQPDSVWYRAGKFVSRYRWGVAAVTAIIIALAVGLGAALWQAGVAKANAEEAQKEAKTAQAVKEFMRGVFYANSAQQPDPGKARETTARELLDLGAARIDAALADAPEAKQEMLMIFTELYSQLGLSAKSLEFAQRRVRLLRELKDASVEDRVYALLLVAITLRNQSIDDPEQRTLLDEALTIVGGGGDTAPALRGVVMTVAANYLGDHDFARALDLSHQAFRLGRDVGDFASISINAARADLLVGDFARARSEAEEGIAASLAYNLSQESGQGTYMQLPVLYECLGLAEAALSEIAPAKEHFRQALREGRKTFGESDPEVVRIEGQLARFLLKQGQRAEGETLLAHAASKLARPSPGGARLAFEALQAVGEAQADAGQLRPALDHLTRALAMRSPDLDASPTVAALLRAQARALFGLGRYAEAESVLNRAITMRQRAGVNAADALREEAGLRVRLPGR